MPRTKLSALCLTALLASCGKPAQPPAQPPETTARATQPRSPTAPPAASEGTVSALDLPERFTALGTEPFWAAKVDGPRLTYSTPEDQAGQSVPVSRTVHAERVELDATLAGQRLTLTVSAGPCSDGMSDTVYPFAVRRRLGDDEQRGCARPG